MITEKIKHVLSSELSTINENVALLLSKGIDSSSLLFTLLEQGKSVTIYSFTLDYRESSDFKGAKKIAETFGVPFIPIYLPTDIELLKKDVLYLIKEKGLKKKTEVECTWAMMYALKTIKETVVVAGLGADGHFVISKKGCLHYKHTVELMNEFRNKLFSNPNYAQKEIVTQLAEEQGKKMILPYLSKNMIDSFKNTTWEELNKPKQKQVILDMYPAFFEQIKVYHHSNFQLGDSGIAEHFTSLMKSDWNQGKGKTVVSIYNAIARGEIY
ncbi:asparagine synthase-related protein [Bacillus sp. M6-12]|uniref:asparagine synthase-related protein n=1 Tax=Bacillus sp. M6-12 TaxID=2054166 RepID=UPI0015E09A4B|nr:asparagine synthase-related protein [Bacillus sp. M6-12]